jgi:5-(carboxyamino)imidazole ribonucleotide mutase
MPAGIPVATVGIDNAKNAGILAARIIGSSDANVATKVQEHLAQIREEAKAKGANLSARRNQKTGFSS